MDHEHFMREALLEAEQALIEQEFPVGCVLVSEGDVLARGHRRNSRPEQCNEIDHAEVVTLRSLLQQYPQFDCSRLVAYSSMEPCLMCFSTMLLSGIRRFVWGYEDIMGGGTALSLDELPPLYKDMEVEIVPGVLRRESLALFGRFFQQYTYWQDSLLAKYTLDQWDKSKRTGE